ncbi:MAG: hypothetical protein MUE73_16740, partial [Planctomycetes bacterium]|nr:hypothetical protein [Planctomycetota bacterium]
MHAPSLVLGNLGIPLLRPGIAWGAVANLLIGLAGGGLLHLLFGARLRRALAAMVLASLLSGLAGLFDTLFLADRVPMPSLSAARVVLYASFPAACLLSALLEWPAALFALRPAPRAGRRGLVACLLAQTLAFLALLPFYPASGDTSLLTATHIVPDLAFVKYPEAVVTYLAPDGTIRRRRLDGSGDEPAPAEPDRPFRPRFNFVFRGPSGRSGWEVRTLERGAVEFLPPSDASAVRLGLDTPLLHLPIEWVSLLGPDGPAIFAAGDLICVLDPATRSIGVVARGRWPRVFLPHVDAGPGDLGMMRSAFGAAVAAGNTESAQRIARRVVDAIDRDCPWANRALGRLDLQEIGSRFPEDDLLEQLPSAEYEELKFVLDDMEDFRWVTPEEYARAESLLRATLVYLEHLRSDEGLVRFLLFASKYRLEDGGLATARPFALGYNPWDIRESHAAEVASFLQSLHREFTDRLLAPLGMPALEALAIDGRAFFAAGLLGKPEDWSKWLEWKDIRIPSEVRAVHDPRSDFLVMFEETGVRAPVSQTVRACFHQFLRRYRRVMLEERLGEALPPDDPRLESRLAWFDAGMEDLVASAGSDGAGGVTLMVPSRGQFAEWKTARDRGLPEWAFDELMETTTG